MDWFNAAIALISTIIRIKSNGKVLGISFSDGKIRILQHKYVFLTETENMVSYFAMNRDRKYVKFYYPLKSKTNIENAL